MKKDNRAVVYVRALATVFILLCHLTQFSVLEPVQLSAQFFNVGVELFILISGFLYGRRKIGEAPWSWFGRKMKKIVVPVGILLVFIILVHILKGQLISFWGCVATAVNLQGILLQTVQGMGHLWYLSAAMLCWLLTPWFQELAEKTERKQLLLGFGIAAAVQLPVALLVSQMLGKYMILMMLYAAAYFFAPGFDPEKLDRPKLLWALGGALGAVALRLVGRLFFDGTAFYDTVLVGYTQAALAVAIFLAVYCWEQKIMAPKGKKPPHLRALRQAANWIDGFSYEIYLVHYMFCVGPLSLRLTGIGSLDALLVTVATAVCAVLLKRANWLLAQKLEKKRLMKE